MRLRVSDATATLALLEHLAVQGFPATCVRRDELDVLFPGSPPLLAAAAELDRWNADHADVTLTYELHPRLSRSRWREEAEICR